MKKIISIITIFILGISVVGSPVSAMSNNSIFSETINTSILTTCNTDNGNGESVLCLLNLVVDIMTIGIGILGVVGITIVGIQYLTAGGSEEKTRKAKRRMFEIVIGLVAYVLIYALLKWLSPYFGGGGTPN